MKTASGQFPQHFYAHSRITESQSTNDMAFNVYQFIDKCADSDFIKVTLRQLNLVVTTNASAGKYAIGCELKLKDHTALNQSSSVNGSDVLHIIGMSTDATLCQYHYVFGDDGMELVFNKNELKNNNGIIVTTFTNFYTVGKTVTSIDVTYCDAIIEVSPLDKYDHAGQVYLTK